jgi:hypothetical protein
VWKCKDCGAFCPDGLNRDGLCVDCAAEYGERCAVCNNACAPGSLYSGLCELCRERLGDDYDADTPRDRDAWENPPEQEEQEGSTT